MARFIRNSLLTVVLFTVVVLVTFAWNGVLLPQFSAFELGAPPPLGLSPYLWFAVQAPVLVLLGAFAFWIYDGRNRSWWTLLLSGLVGLWYAHYAPSWTGPLDWHVVYPVGYFLVGAAGLLAGAVMSAWIHRRWFAKTA
jgi:hypothetical protein